MAQKSLISIITTVAAELNLPQPVTVVSNQDQNIQKLLVLCRAVCDDLLAEYDWQILQTRYSFSTTNGVDSYALPSDIERFISTTFFDANNRYPMQGPKSPVEWEWIKSTSFQGLPYTQFRIYNNKFWIAPVPGVSPFTFNLEYISNNVAKNLGTGVGQSDFTQDSDICLFDHRPVIYGIKLKMRESIGLDTTAALSDYKRALEASKGTDTPSPTLNLLGATGLRQLSTANYPDGSWVV